MTVFPWKAIGTLVSDWALSNLDASHGKVMERVNAAMNVFVPEVVAFGVNACKNGPLAFMVEHFEDDSIEKIGLNILALWPAAADSLWTFCIDAAYAAADAAFGVPTA
jgi:hypothetical protein